MRRDGEQAAGLMQEIASFQKREGTAEKTMTRFRRERCLVTKLSREVAFGLP